MGTDRSLLGQAHLERDGRAVLSAGERVDHVEPAHIRRIVDRGEQLEVGESVRGLQRARDLDETLAGRAPAGQAARAEHADVGDADNGLEHGARGENGGGDDHSFASIARRVAAESSPAALRSISVISALMRASGRGGHPGM